MSFIFRITWSALVKEFEKVFKNTSEIRTLLNPLCQVAKKLAGDEHSEEVVEECAVWLLCFFLEKEDVCTKDVVHLKTSFCSIDLPLAKEVHKVNSLLTVVQTN